MEGVKPCEDMAENEIPLEKAEPELKQAAPQKDDQPVIKETPFEKWLKTIGYPSTTSWSTLAQDWKVHCTNTGTFLDLLCSPYDASVATVTDIVNFDVVTGVLNGGATQIETTEGIFLISRRVALGNVGYLIQGCMSPVNFAQRVVDLVRAKKILFDYVSTTAQNVTDINEAIGLPVYTHKSFARALNYLKLSMNIKDGELLPSDQVTLREEFNRLQLDQQRIADDCAKQREIDDRIQKELSPSRDEAIEILERLERSILTHTMFTKIRLIVSIIMNFTALAADCRLLLFLLPYLVCQFKRFSMVQDEYRLYYTDVATSRQDRLARLSRHTVFEQIANLLTKGAYIVRFWNYLGIDLLTMLFSVKPKQIFVSAIYLCLGFLLAYYVYLEMIPELEDWIATWKFSRLRPTLWNKIFGEIYIDSRTPPDARDDIPLHNGLFPGTAYDSDLVTVMYKKSVADFKRRITKVGGYFTNNQPSLPATAHDTDFDRLLHTTPGNNNVYNLKYFIGRVQTTFVKLKQHLLDHR